MTDLDSEHCDDCQRSLEEFAFGELPEGDSARIEVHLATGCEACNMRLAEIARAVAVLPAGLNPQLPPLRIEQQLMRRVAGQPAEQAVSAKQALSTGSSGRPKAVGRGLIAATVALAACLVFVAAWISWRNAAPDSSESLDAWASLQRRMEEAERSQHLASTPRLEFVQLRTGASLLPVSGYVVADDIARQWHVYIFNLPVVPEGRAYQLWFVDGDSRHRPVGIAQVDSAGTLSYLIDLPSDIGALHGVAVSDEPSSGSAEPTGDIFYRAELPH